MTYTLRDLPAPVKAVTTVFLLAVGLGYTSAMLQLHIQDSKKGSPMPTPEDVVLKFTGKKKFDPSNPPPRPVSRLEALVVADGEDITGTTMAGAFTTQDRAPKPLKFSEMVKARPAAEVKAERKGEQAVFALWINAPDAERKAAYAADKFTPPADKMPKAFTAALKDGDAVKIKTLVDARCVTCHSNGGEKGDVPLDNYECLSRFMEVSAPAPPVHGYVKVEEPISISKLTQSTHAHLLSFAMLFSLTGLIFACSSWPKWMRVIGGPWVVVAIFADVSLWWLARLCNEFGPFFAQGVIVTGFLAGVGLFGQIAGSLFTMYGLKGRAVIGLLFLVGALGGGWFVTQLLVPALPKPKAVEEKKEDKKDEKKIEDPKTDGKNGVADAGTGGRVAAAGGAIAGGAVPPRAVPVVVLQPTTALDSYLLPEPGPGGKLPKVEDLKFAGSEQRGGMVRAFFDKDKKFDAAMKAAPPAQQEQLRAQRHGEWDAVVAWSRTPEAVRKSAYEGDAFTLPGLSDKTVTPDFVKDGKVAIKSLINNRCVTCHGPCGKQSDYPLDTYEGLSAYLKPLDAPK